MVTTIETEKSIAVKLPPIVTDQQESPKNERNVLRILTNNLNEIMVNEERIEPSLLQMKIKSFVTNNGRNKKLSDSPEDAVISLLSKDGTEYWRYVSIHNDVRAVYNQLWNEAALETYLKFYKDLNKDEKDLIRKKYPLRISEAESR